MGKLLGLQKTGYLQDTPDHYLIDAATLYKNLVYNPTSGQYTGELIGATNGGVEIDITQKYRDVEVDGTYWTPVKGNKALSNTEVVAKASLKEVTAETLRLSINGSRRTVTDVNEAPAGYEIVEGKRYVDDTDYIDSVAVVGKLSGSNKPVIFWLDNCLATAGAKIKTEDDKEAEIPVELTAHADYDQVSNDKLPYRIVFPTSADVELSDITLALDNGQDAAKLAVDGVYKLIPTPVPATAELGEIIFASSDRTVVTIDQSGNISAIAAGTAEIIVITSTGEITATLSVTVVPVVNVTGITATPASKDLKVGDTGVIGLDASSDIKLALTPAGANAYSLKFESSNPNFATVDIATGAYEAIAAGNATITITATNTADNSTKTATTLLKVTAAP